MSKKVLILDDDSQIVEALGIILRTAGYQTVLINDPDDIVQRVQKEQPDLCIIDVRLGSADGREITHALKLNPSTAHIPVILMSARVGNLSDDQLQGADLYMPKPFRMRDLLAAVPQYINSSSSSSP